MLGSKDKQNTNQNKQDEVRSLRVTSKVILVRRNSYSVRAGDKKIFETVTKCLQTDHEAMMGVLPNSI